MQQPCVPFSHGSCSSRPSAIMRPLYGSFVAVSLMRLLYHMLELLYTRGDVQLSRSDQVGCDLPQAAQHLRRVVGVDPQVA